MESNQQVVGEEEAQHGVQSEDQIEALQNGGQPEDQTGNEDGQASVVKGEGAHHDGESEMNDKVILDERVIETNKDSHSDGIETEPQESTADDINLKDELENDETLGTEEINETDGIHHENETMDDGGVGGDGSGGGGEHHGGDEDDTEKQASEPLTWTDDQGVVDDYRIKDEDGNDEHNEEGKETERKRSDEDGERMSVRFKIEDEYISDEESNLSPSEIATEIGTYADGPHVEIQVKTREGTNEHLSNEQCMNHEDTGIDWCSETTEQELCITLPSLYGKPVIRPHEWVYRPAPPILRNPFRIDYAEPTRKARCGSTNGLLTTRYAGPDRRRGVEDRRRIRERYMEHPNLTSMHPNPVGTVPMRPRKWKKRAWFDPPKGVQEWKAREDSDKLKKDHETAQKLGYETLVGNLVYSDIPGARDLNRSWKHFLNKDPMAWGFPYLKGSRERPSLPQPAPYLVHQLKEGLWKYPRNKLILQSNTTDD